MARLPRMIIPGLPQHVIVRGNNRGDIFYCEQDYRFYLDKLLAACNKHALQVHAYVLMTNHVHLLATPLATHSLGKAMQMLGRYYVQYFNRCYRRTGTLWEGRYRATLVDSEAYLFTCMRYIELNPVRAGVVADPAEYPWSSCGFNTLGRANPLVTPHHEFQRLAENEAERHAAYQALFKQIIPEVQLKEIRDATNKAWALGDKRFKERIQRQLARRVEPAARGGDRKSAQFKIARA